MTEPAAVPEPDGARPTSARLIAVLAAVVVACAGLVSAAWYLTDRGPDASAAAPAATAVPMHELGASEAPTVQVTAAVDAAGGWNLHIVTTRFTWAPEQSGQAHVTGAGHAHVWVGDTKVGRAYGEWFYLPEALVPVGTQTVRVSLNGNDHGDYAVGGKKVEASTTVTSTAKTASDGHHHEH